MTATADRRVVGARIAQFGPSENENFATPPGFCGPFAHPRIQNGTDRFWMMEMKMTQFAPTRGQTFRQTRPARGQPSVVSALMTAPLRWLARVWIEHRDERLLQGLSDTQLRDLGITRSQIPHVVRDGLCR